MHEYGAESLAQRVRGLLAGVHDGFDALFVVNAGIAPRRATQGLPQDVIVCQAGPHASGQTQIGGVQVFEYLKRQLGRNLIEIRKLDSGFKSLRSAARVCHVLLAGSGWRLVGPRGELVIGTVRNGGWTELELFQFIKQQTHVWR